VHELTQKGGAPKGCTLSPSSRQWVQGGAARALFDHFALLLVPISGSPAIDQFMKGPHSLQNPIQCSGHALGSVAESKVSGLVQLLVIAVTASIHY
jgi:hypothetical protein